MRNRSAVFIQANFVLCVGVVAAFVFAVSTSAQAPLPPTPKTPDLLGIYPGMAYQAARAQLQKHAANVALSKHETCSVPERVGSCCVLEAF